MKIIYALEERIGNQNMFFGREKELNYFLKWVDNVPRKLSKSTVILSRRKKGKTALMERLYNIIYTQNRNIIPFYYEIMEKKYYIKEFAEDFYLSFIRMYLGFKTRNVQFIKKMMSYKELEKCLRENELTEALDDLKGMYEILYNEKNIDMALKYALSAPHRIGNLTGEYVVQIIDEFQFLNQNIYDERTEKQIDIAGMYMSFAESKIAPVIVTGSWVTWLRDILRTMLPSRFKEYELKNFTEEEGVGAVLNYCNIAGIPITEENAIYIANLIENDPFYISAVILSDYEEKDLMDEKSIVDTIEFEVTKGMIYWTWMEYISATFDNINNINAKKIVLFLAKNGENEFGIKDIIKECNLEMTERECEAKLKMLERGDLIRRGSSTYFYRGVGDNVLSRVLRAEYEYVINNVERELILRVDKEEDLKKIEELRKQLNVLRGQFNYHKGHALEYYIQDYLRHITSEDSKAMEERVYNYQDSCSFKKYKEVHNKTLSIEGMNNMEFDVWAVPHNEGNEILVMECKNTDKQIGIEDVLEFINKVKTIKGKGYNPVSIFYSKNGFTEEAINCMKANKLMWTDDKIWN